MKELEELERLTEYFEALKNIKIRCHSKSMNCDPIDFDLDIIEQALNELKAIKEAAYLMVN